MVWKTVRIPTSAVSMVSLVFMGNEVLSKYPLNDVSRACAVLLWVFFYGIPSRIISSSSSGLSVNGINLFIFKKIHN